MQNQGSVPKGVMTIRVFYPNPLIPPQGYKADFPENCKILDIISRLYNVTYLEVLDPIYHELCFIDDKGIRHRIIGLAYHLEEKMADAGGIDGTV